MLGLEGKHPGAGALPGIGEIFVVPVVKLRVILPVQKLLRKRGRNSVDCRCCGIDAQFGERAAEGEEAVMGTCLSVQR